ncbi:MAG: hypothetical protein WDO69_33775 [Pseudomonadota bacterium]
MTNERRKDRKPVFFPGLFEHPQLLTALERSGFSRRNFLRVMTAGAAACAVGTPACTQPNGSGESGGFGDAPRYQPQTPFALSHQSVLSEDYFEVTNHKIDVDNGDKVVAYTRSNGDTEAVVLQDGVVKLVYRDASQAGGWMVFALPDAIDVTDMVAAVGQPNTGDPYLQISYVTKDSPDTLVVAMQSASPIGASGPTFQTKTVAWDKKAGALAITMGATFNLHGYEPLVSAMIPGSEGDDASDAKVCWAFSGWKKSGVLTGFSFNTWNGDQSWSVVLMPSIYTNVDHGGFVLSIAKANGSLEMWGTTEGIDGGPMKLMNLPQAFPPQDPSGFRTVVSDIVGLFWLKFSDPLALPAALVWTQHQDPLEGGLIGHPLLWLVTPTGSVGNEGWVWTNLAVPTDQDTQFDIPVTTALTPRKTVGNGYLLNVFVSWGGTLRVVRQIEQGGATDIQTPVFTPLIPLQPEVRTMSSQAAPSPGNELILVGADGTLQTLEKDAANGAWTDAVIQLPASELQELSSYRVTLTLADTAWGAPVASQDVVITASTPALAIIEGPSPKTVRLSNVPVTATTDANGEVLLALVAEGLSAPTLTITSAGLPTPATVHPSEPINTYMQGQGTLNFLPAMSGDTLAHAKTPDGQTVAPGAADAGAARDAASKMKQAADLGVQGSLLGAVASTIGRLDGTRPVSVELLGSSIDHWAHDVLHAVKKGAAAVKDTTIDVERKIVSIAVDVEGWTDNIVQVAVHSIEDAAHVLHSVLNQLKADIVAAVKWLRALVASLLQDSALVATEFSALIRQACDFVGDDADKLKAVVDAWFVGKEEQIQNAFDAVRKGYPDNATLGTIGDFNPAQLVGATRTPPVASDDDAPQPHGDWFLNKVKHAIYGQLDTPQFTGISFDKLQLNVLEACSSHIDDFASAAQGFWSFIKTAVTHPSEFPSLAVHGFLEEVSKLIQAALKLLNAAVDALFAMIAALSKAIPDMLSTKIGKAGIVGKLLSLAGLGDFQIGTVAMMVFAFPTTLAYKIANGPDTRPFSYVMGAQGRPGADPDTDRALQITAASVMGVWAGLDAVGNGLKAVGGEGVPMLTPAVDLAGPLLVGALAPPFVKDGLPDWRLNQNTAQDTLGLVSWLFDLIPAYGSAQVMYAEHSQSVDVKAQTEDGTFWLQTMCGVMSLVAGVSAASSDPDANGKDYAVPILLNVPNIVACFYSKALIETSEGASAVLGVGFSLFGGVAGAVEYGSD